MALTVPVHGSQSYKLSGEELPNIGPNLNSRRMVPTRNWNRTESVLKLVGTSMKTTLQRTCELFKVSARGPIAKSEFSKNMIEILRGCADVIHHSSSQQYLDKLMLRGLILQEEQTEKKADNHVTSSAAHPRQSRAGTRSKSWQTRSFRSSHDLVKPQDTGLTLYQTLSYALYTSRTFQQTASQE